MGKTAVFQMQDVMALDNEARMNTPGKAVGNWAWRMGDAAVWTKLKASATRLYDMNKLYDRCGIVGTTLFLCYAMHPCRLPKVEVPQPKAQQPERSLSMGGGNGSGKEDPTAVGTTKA